MKTALLWLAVTAVMIAAFVHYGAHLPQLKQASILPRIPSPAPASSPILKPASDKMVTFVGPLAQWMDKDNASEASPENRAVGKAHLLDHIAPSPVGTSSAVVHKTFAISSGVIFPFEIPAHSVNAQLRGNYRSYPGRQEVQARDDSANVSFLLMNEQQYISYAADSSAEVLLALEPSRDQDVNFGLPASRDVPVKYYLVFRNNLREGKKIVKADFTVDF